MRAENDLFWYRDRLTWSLCEGLNWFLHAGGNHALVRASKLTWFLSGWSKLTLFQCGRWNLNLFQCRDETDLVVVWVIEIDLISVEGLKLARFLCDGPK